MNEGFAETPDRARIQYLSSSSWDASLAPLFCVPGMLGHAELYRDEIASLAPRRVIAVSNRGLGKSTLPAGAPASFSARCLDIATIVGVLKLPKYLLMGFSRGVPIAVQHALQNPREVVGLVLVDCPPIYTRMSDAWLAQVLRTHKGVCEEETLKRLQVDSSDVDLGSRMDELSCPILFFRGALKGALLSEAQLGQMLQVSRGDRARVLPTSAHEISNTDYDLFIGELKTFMAGA